jgi:hypothetical protein
MVTTKENLPEKKRRGIVLKKAEREREREEKREAAPSSLPFFFLPSPTRS